MKPQRPIVNSVLAEAERAMACETRYIAANVEAARAEQRASELRRKAEEVSEERRGVVDRLRDIIGAALVGDARIKRLETADGVRLDAMFASATIRRRRETNGVYYTLGLTVVLDERQSFVDDPKGYRNLAAAEKAARKALEPYTAAGRLAALGMDPDGDLGDKAWIDRLVCVVPAFQWAPGGTYLTPRWEVRVGSVTLRAVCAVDTDHAALIKPLGLLANPAEGNAQGAEDRYTDPIRRAFYREVSRPRPTSYAALEGYRAPKPGTPSADEGVMDGGT